MNKNDLLNLWAVLTDLKAVKANVKFSYAVARNRHLLETEVKSVQEAISPAQEFLIFEQARIALAKDYADKDDSGNPKIVRNSFVVTEKLSEFNEKMAALREKHTDAIAAQTAREGDINKLLEEEFVFEPHKIDFDILPEEISPEVIEVFIQCGVMEWE